MKYGIIVGTTLEKHIQVDAKDMLAIIQTMPFLIMWPRFVLSVRHSCALSHLPEVAVPRMTLA